ncbi:outer membrane protein assembly factor BamB family protein [Paludisphaera soli]|uniref:outer membrane protein assembly factor BamB family protein n=1 Tax=Paludisphaera soli TaxID=2712865 RepID=UPI0013EA9611|nr:PQQ-binding-like beta-propeller repeat protein [Paludisphaera soli]
MATLEIHDADGRVRFVDLDRSHPILFGSGAACDIVLAGEGVLPVHGRIRWRGRRFKVDASPDAEFLEVNGSKIVSATLRQGDELTVGPCRMFVLRLDDPGTESAPRRDRRRPARAEADEPTRVLSGPAEGSHVEAPVIQAPPRRVSVFEKDDVLATLDLDLPPNEAKAPPIASSARRPPKGKGAGTIARLLARWRNPREADAPGREVIAASPTVLALVALLGLLIAMGFWLNGIIVRTIASRTFNHAMELLEDGDNATAIREFDSFLEKNLEDPRAGKALTLRALANVRQYISVSGATWSRALEAAREMVDTVGELPEYRDEKSELGDLTIRIGEGLADRARRTPPDAKSLAEAEEAVALHARIAGESAPAFLTKSRLPDLINEARAAIRKADALAAAIAAMDRAIGRKSATEVYKARDGLVLAYADLSKHPKVVERMVLANDLMRQAARVDPSRRPGETTERPEPLGPATSLVSRSRSDAPASPLAADGVAYALADGAAYAIDAATGAPLWRTPVGLACTVVPAPVPGDASVLTFDARHHELCRRDARTGRLIWRQGLEEDVDAAPLVMGEQVYQTLPSGRLRVLALATGEVEATVDLGFPVTRTPVADESGRFLYVMGRKDCLFVIARDPLACVDVQYLGHGEGSIPCPPARLGRFLVVAENDGIGDSRWRVLVLDEDGSRPRAVQTIEVAGWTWDSPPTSGSSIWAVGDRGGLEVFAAGDYAGANPFRSIARLSPDLTSTGPAFGFTSSERDIWVAASRTARYDLDGDGGRLASRYMLGDLGPAAGPIRAAGRRLILSFESRRGGVSLRGVDPSAGEIEWETVIGGPWPVPPVAWGDGDSLASVDRAGRQIRIPRADLERGGFVTTLLPRPGDPQAPDGLLTRVAREGRELTLLAPGRGGSELWTESDGGWKRSELPSVLAASPLPWSGGLLIPGEDGRAYLIDPTSGRSDAEPLVPEFERDRTGRWLAPAALDGDSVLLADDAGRVRRLGFKAAPERRIVIEAEATLDQRILADPACTRTAVVLAMADGSVRSLAARDLSPVGSWKLDAPLLGAPMEVDGRVVAFDAAGGVTLFDTDGRRAWTSTPGAPALGAPLIRGDVVWILDREAHARGLALADGREVGSIELGAQPTGGLIAVGPDVLAPTGRGVLQPIKLEAAGGTKP